MRCEMWHKRPQITRKIFLKINVALWSVSVTIGTVMDTQDKSSEFTEEVKARVPQRLKRRVQRLAKRRLVSDADILRAALDEYLSRCEAA